jgi:hypothetical protein
MASDVEKSNEILILTDSMAEEKKRIESGQDATTDPHGEKRWALNPSNPNGKNNMNIGLVQPAINIVDPEELYRASFTPKGSYITRVSSRMAFFQGWKVVSEKDERDPADDAIVARIKELNKQYNLKNKFIQMTRSGAIFGQSLAFIQLDRNNKPFIRVAPIRQTEIDYDDVGGYPTIFHPIVQWGRGVKQLDIPADKAVLFIWDDDECGNGYTGIPALVSSYQTILRSEVVSDEYSTIIAERGLGFVDILAKHAKTLKELEKVRKSFKLGSDRVFVHSDEYEAKAQAGVQSNINFDEAMGRYTKDVSSSTGYPGMAMEGVQVGAVTGSETDQDNRAQMYKVIQEMAEPYMMKVYFLLDPKLKDKMFDFDWEYEIKQDRSKKANTFVTFSNAISSCQDLIKVDQALQLLELPPFGEEDGGNLLVSEWIAINSPTIDTQPDDPNRPNNDINPKDVPKPENDPTMPEKGNPDEKKEKLDTVAKDSNDVKTEIVKRLLNAGDSYTMINYFLKRVFGSGMSNSSIAALKNS